MFGLFKIDSREIQEGYKTLVSTFRNDPESYGVPRYENDYYHRVSEDVLGNWWFITSLWLAQYSIEIDDREQANAILDWTKKHALSTHVMSEQINPHDGTLLSVAPLTWSHAEFVATLLDTINEKD